MSLKARYKLNGNVEEINGLISGTINTECMRKEYTRQSFGDLTNVNIFSNSDYIATIESGYIYVYDQKGNEIWNTKKEKINQYGISIKSKCYNDIVSTVTSDNSVAVAYCSKINGLYTIYVDIYDIYGQILVDRRIIAENISSINNVSLILDNDYLYSLVDETNNNKMNVIDRIGTDTVYAPIKLNIKSNIKANPYNIRKIIEDEDGNWYLLIESNGQFFIQKNRHIGTIDNNQWILLNDGVNDIEVTLMNIIETEYKLGIVSKNKLYTIDKDHNKLYNIQLCKTFNNNIKICKTYQNLKKFSIVCEHTYLPEGVKISYIMDTDIYIMDYDFKVESINQSRYHSRDIAIDSTGSIYICMAGNKLIKYQSALSFTDEGVIADKCARFNGGNSRIVIENPFYDKVNEKAEDLTNTGFSVSLWYKPKTFDWEQQVILGGIVLPDWKDITYSSYWNKFFMVAENINMLAVGGYEPEDGILVWRAYNIYNLEHKIKSFSWVPEIRRFIAIGEDSNQYYISENGLEWTVYSLNEDIRLNKIVYNTELKTTFLIGYDCLIQIDGISTNNTTITYYDNMPDYNYTDIAYANGRYVLISDETNSIFVNDNGLNKSWQEIKTGCPYEWKSITVGNYTTDKVFFISPVKGKNMYKLGISDIVPTTFKLDSSFDEIRKVKIMNNKLHILTNENYCSILKDDGTWNTTDIVFGGSYVPDDLIVGNLCVEYNYIIPNLDIEWKKPLEYMIAVIDEADFVFCANANTVGTKVPVPVTFYKTYFINEKRSNIWHNFLGTWESYSNTITETWKTLSLHDKSTNIITDFAMVIGYNRHLYLVYDNQKFKTNFVFDGSKLDNWYNFIVTVDGIAHTLTLYVNNKFYNTFEYEPYGNLKITSKTITLGDINKHTGSIRKAEIWLDFCNTWSSLEYNGYTWKTLGKESFWDYNYYNLYGCINDVRLYNHQLDATERKNITDINVGTYPGEIYTGNYPTDLSEFSNDLKTDKLFCINKDWSISFMYQCNSIVDKLIFNKADQYGGLFFGYFDGENIPTDPIWCKVLKKWRVIKEDWEHVLYNNIEHNIADNDLYLFVFDRRDKRDFRKIRLLKDSFVTDKVYFGPAESITGYVKGQDDDKEEINYNIVLYRFNKIDVTKEHRFGFTYNYVDRIMKVYLNGQILMRLFNLEYKNSELPFILPLNDKKERLSDLKIYHSCLSEEDMAVN